MPPFAATADILVLCPQRTQRITGKAFRISFHSKWQIDRPIMARTRILVDRWGPTYLWSRLPEEGDASVLVHQHGPAVTSLANQQFGKIWSLGAPAQVDSCIMSVVNFLRKAFSEPYSLPLLSENWMFPWNSFAANGLRSNKCYATNRLRIFQCTD